MVKQFELTEHFDISITTFFSYLLEESHFEEYVHKLRGNTDISVTRWTSLGNNHWERFCKYTMADVDKKGMGNFLCMETQKYFYVGDTLRLDSTISPQGPSEDLFNIKSEWTLSPSIEQCDLKIFVEVECKRSIGYKGVIEGTLASRIRSACEIWCKAALEKVKEERERFFNTKSILETTIEIYDTNRDILQDRLKSFQHKVVTGTENIVKLLKSSHKTNFRKQYNLSHELSLSDRTNTPSLDNSEVLDSLSFKKDCDESMNSVNTIITIEPDEGGTLLTQSENDSDTGEEKRTYNPVMWFIFIFCLLFILLIYVIGKQ